MEQIGKSRNRQELQTIGIDGAREKASREKIFPQKYHKIGKPQLLSSFIFWILEGSQESNPEGELTPRRRFEEKYEKYKAAEKSQTNAANYRIEDCW